MGKTSIPIMYVSFFLQCPYVPLRCRRIPDFQSSHDAAEENLVLILFKSPRCEWESKPTPIPAAKTSAHVKEGSPEGTGVSKEGTDAPPTPREKTGSDGLAPGHGSIGNREKVSAVDYESLAYELD